MLLGTRGRPAALPGRCRTPVVGASAAVRATTIAVGFGGVSACSPNSQLSGRYHGRFLHTLAWLKVCEYLEQVEPTEADTPSPSVVFEASGSIKVLEGVTSATVPGGAGSGSNRAWIYLPTRTRRPSSSTSGRPRTAIPITTSTTSRSSSGASVDPGTNTPMERDRRLGGQTPRSVVHLDLSVCDHRLERRLRTRVCRSQ